MNIADALRDASTTPYWLDNPERPDPQPALRGHTTADLVIVGGGFTGLWTALQAVEDDPDRSIVLLEGTEIGWAASGRNGGFCSASLTHGYDNGAHHLPDENDRLAELGLRNLDGIQETVERLGLDCDFERTGELSIAFEPWQVRELEAEHDPGNGYRWLDAEELRDHIRPAGALGGLLDERNNAMINPAKLCWELRRVLLERGVRIHEHSLVRDLRQDTDGMIVDTDQGSVTAHRIALATNVFPTLLKKTTFHTVPVYDYALMTEPLTDAQMDAIGWRHREGLDDVTNRFHYFRLTADNRILWGGWDAVYHFGKRVLPKYDQRPETFETLARQFYEMFPQLDGESADGVDGGVIFTHKWGGAIDTCSRFFPFFTTGYGGRVAYTAGFTGLGVGASRFAGRVMLDLLGGQPTELTQLDMVRKMPKPFPPEPAAWLGVQMMTKALIRADENEGRRGLFLKVMDRLKMGFDS
ncbi:NAD(P)/FAD-dependent oxidoreductase [Corynebacterium glyciniphilum]|uniref:NAD(P)/FAD-dependent oxidoreductase n=1 Tax=Corynebacterium glyciniphilum TaxID=1404244 RepID=UPI0011AB3F96|nr:FAD-dependent oxidoreductase [Corynebacterium glyciniphilum]